MFNNNVNLVNDINSVAHIDTVYIDCLDNKYFNIDDLSIFTMNIRSFVKNIDLLLILLDSVVFKFDVIVLSETLLNNDIDFMIDGYHIIHSLCVSNKCDGILVLVKNDVLIRNVSKNILSNCNSIQINIVKGNVSFYLTGIYRSSNNNYVDSFLLSLSDYLSHCGLANHVLCGDINIDILSNSNISCEYLNILISEGFFSACNNYTRINDHSNSCIDHIQWRSQGGG